VTISNSEILAPVREGAVQFFVAAFPVLLTVNPLLLPRLKFGTRVQS